MWFPVVRTPLKCRRQSAVVSSVTQQRRTPRRGTGPWSTAKLCTYIPLVPSLTDNLNGKGYTVDLHCFSNTLNTLIFIPFHIPIIIPSHYNNHKESLSPQLPAVCTQKSLISFYDTSRSTSQDQADYLLIKQKKKKTIFG